jgi:hypothetical protein
MGTTTAIKTAEFGVIGLGVMGQNLALNIEDHGQSVAVWNLEPEWVDLCRTERRAPDYRHKNPARLRAVVGAAAAPADDDQSRRSGRRNAAQAGAVSGSGRYRD